MSNVRLAGIAGLAALIVVCASAAILLSIELNRIRPRIESALTRAFGRDVVIEGEVTVGLALAPELVARGIRIDNPEWASRDFLAYTERAEIQFELLPLLRDGRFIVSNLEFEGADIRLEQRDDGSNNWSIVGDVRTDSPLPQIHRLALGNSVVVFVLPDSAQRRLYLEDFEATRTGYLALEAQLTGAFRDWPFEIELAGAPSRDPGKPRAWPFEAVVDSGGLRAELAGEFAEAFRLPGLEFDLRIIGGDAGWLEQIFDLTPFDVRYRLASSVSVTDSGFSLRSVQGSLEDVQSVESLVVTDGGLVFDDRALEISSEGLVDGVPFAVSIVVPEVVTATELSGIRAQVRLNNTDASAVGVARWADGALGLDFELSVASPRVDDFSELINVALPAWGPLRVAAHLSASDGYFNLTELAARLGRSQLEGDLLLSATAPRPRVSGNVRSVGVDLSDFLSADLAGWDHTSLDAVFPLGWMTALDVELSAEIEELTGAPVPVRDLSFSGSLERGEVKLDPFAVTVATVSLSGTGTLSADPEPSLELRARAGTLAPEGILRSLELPESAWGVLRGLELRLVASGRSMTAAFDRLSLELSADSGDLDFIAGFDNDLPDLRLDSVRLIQEGDGAAELTLSGSVESLPFDLLVSGGRLRDLLSDGEMWPALGLSITTQIAEQPVTLFGELRPFENLLRRRDVTLQLAGDLADVHAEAVGVIGSIEDVIHTPFDVSVSSENPVEFVDWLDFDPRWSRPFEASGAMKFEDHAIVVRDVRAIIDDNEITGGELVVTPAQPLRVTAALEVSVLDLDPIIDDFYAGTDADTGTDADADADADTGPSGTTEQRLFSSRSLAREWLSAIDLDSSLQIGELHALDKTLRGVSSATQLDKGILTWWAATQDGTVSASIEFDPRGDIPEASINLQLRDYRPVDRAATVELASSPVGPLIGAEVLLDGQGESVADILSSADGGIKIWTGPGDLRAIPGGLFGRSLVTQVLRLVSRDEPETRLACGAVYFEVEDGIASTPRGIALQTQDLNILGGGAINLKTEELQIRFRFQPRRGLGLSVAGMTAPFVNMGGTLRQPRVRLNTGTSIAAGSAAWATGGLSLLYTGVFQRIFSAQRPCERVLPELAQN